MKKLLTGLVLIAVFCIGFFGFAYLFSPKENTPLLKNELTLKAGTWVLENDSLSSLEVTTKQLVFKYEGISNENDIFNYLVTNQTNKNEGIVLKIFNQMDTLQFEIMGQNDTLLNLLDLSLGRTSLYILKK